MEKPKLYKIVCPYCGNSDEAYFKDVDIERINDPFVTVETFCGQYFRKFEVSPATCERKRRSF
ncbi:MAG: hypothetical protein LUD72_06390 [Bacteroidales bacterium]|nr:hypothetical protein [Bacteroidales bacterium]